MNSVIKTTLKWYPTQGVCDDRFPLYAPSRPHQLPYAIFKMASTGLNIDFREKCSILMFLRIKFSTRLKKEKCKKTNFEIFYPSGRHLGKTPRLLSQCASQPQKKFFSMLSKSKCTFWRCSHYLLYVNIHP